ncbi:hypothetical protein MHL39_10760 [Roseomonas mucosa]|jgi:hypothetical protein|uniref:hypothetical protein n=1 Tax=Roseomonas mucosa TaxID=207340 RepID=UPI001EF4A77B|nr:hypothetical protein [Roseomonas mucosa]MCG7357119.1 hypothetical protein [Roseomonas mucosa]
MRRVALALVAFAAVAGASAPSFAQQTAGASSGSQAIAIAGGGGNGTVTYGGGYDVRNVPSPQSYLVLPPCGSGASIGVGWAGAGFSASAGGEAEGCARRATAAALNAMGMREEALELLRQADPAVAKAFATVAERRAAQPAAAAPPPALVDGVPFPGAKRLPDGRWVRM